MSKNPEQQAGPNAREIIKRDRIVMSPAYGRPYPLVYDHAKGSEVWDVDGKRYVDFCAGIAVNSTGHSHPEVVKAVSEQAEKFLHSSSDFYHELMVSTAERINEIVPIKEGAQIFFTNSGTESVEAAIKLAKFATGRKRFIGFYGGFHGRSNGSLSFTASKYTQQEGTFPTMPGVEHVPYPNPYRPRFIAGPGEDEGDAVVSYIENTVFAGNVPPHEVAGVLVEPIQGEGGYLVPPPHFFPRLRELCDRYGILLIADEVQSGVGRTGKWWAIEHEGVEPDIICMAKGIASGLPFGAMAARRSVSEKWKPGAHGNTYGGNPLACAAAIKTIELIKNGYMENAAKMGEYTMDALTEIQGRHPVIGEVRGRGLMIGVELVKDPVTKEPNQELRNAVEQKCFENGLITLGCGKNSIRLSPALMIEQERINEGLEIFEKSLTEAEQQTF